jgi:hypothetical protein
MALSVGADSRDNKRVQRGEILMGRPLHFLNWGGFGLVYVVVPRYRRVPSFSPFVVKQESDPDSTPGELAHEYSIARFLETRLPSFVAAPFGLMRGVHSAYEEEVSLLQHRVDGKTFASVSAVRFSTPELCALFLLCNEFYLRLGGALKMGVMHTGNIMVDTRPRVKFIDFGLWRKIDHAQRDFDSFYDVMCSNFSVANDPMVHLLTVMGLDIETYKRLYSFFYHSPRMIAKFDELAAGLKRLEIPGGNEIVRTEQFIVVQKLCSIRHLQFLRKVPMDVISEYVDLTQGA